MQNDKFVRVGFFLCDSFYSEKKRVFCATFQQKRNIYDHLKQLKNTFTKKRVKTHFFLQGCYSRKACDRNNLEKQIVSVWLSLINFLTFAYIWRGEILKRIVIDYVLGTFACLFLCASFPLKIRKN